MEGARRSRAARRTRRSSDAIGADTIDEALIRQKSAEAAAVDADIAVARAHARAEVFQILTADQKAQLKTMQAQMKEHARTATAAGRDGQKLEANEVRSGSSKLFSFSLRTSTSDFDQTLTASTMCFGGDAEPLEQLFGFAAARNLADREAVNREPGVGHRFRHRVANAARRVVIFDGDQMAAGRAAGGDQRRPRPPAQTE